MDGPTYPGAIAPERTRTVESLGGHFGAAGDPPSGVVRRGYDAGWHIGHSGPDSPDSRKEHIEDDVPLRLRLLRAATGASSCSRASAGLASTQDHYEHFVKRLRFPTSPRSSGAHRSVRPPDSLAENGWPASGVAAVRVGE